MIMSFIFLVDLEMHFGNCRLDNSASILDLRLEGQDLEKFSIINRFAKYLGGVENDNSETSTTRKPSARRYVYSIPPPRNFPDWVQCLSL